MTTKKETLPEQLIVAHLCGEATPEQERQLLSWLDGSEANRREFRAMKDAWDLGRVERDIARADTTRQWNKMRQAIEADTRQQRRGRLADLRNTALRYAAVFVLGVVAFKAVDLLRQRENRHPMAVTSIETGVGERTKITLPDNSVVWLNSCSSLSYDGGFGGKQRSVKIRGEAFFSVFSDKTRPFLVHSDNLTYRVTGTSFNVCAFADESIESLMLVEGSVSLQRDDYTLPVKAGQLVEYDKKTHKIAVRRGDPAFHTGWRFGELAFERMTFEELVKRLERNFDVKFVFQNEKVKSESFAGTFRSYESLDTIMKVISVSTPIKYRIDHGMVYID